MFPKSPKIQEYQNHHPNPPKINQNHQKSRKITKKPSKINQNLLKSMKKHKKSQKTQRQRENDLRPKLVPTTLAVLGILSSCPRVMTMQCWKSQIPPPLSTRPFVRCLFFSCAAPKRKETRLSKTLQKKKLKDK